MAIRSVAFAGLALAAALAWAAPGRAQGLFSSYEMSPRQIVGMLENGGYHLRGPMYRRAGVYVCDVVTDSGRQSRLIVNARDGHILERYAAQGWRRRDYNDPPSSLRPPRDVGKGDDTYDRDRRMALGDLFNPPSRVYGGDNPLAPKPDDAAPKPKHHAAKKHKEPAVAKATPEPTPETTTGDKPAAPPSAAALAPTPTPEAKKPAQDNATPAAAPTPMQTNAQAEKPAEPKPAASPKPEPQRKKLNDLPVGTLD